MWFNCPRHHPITSHEFFKPVDAPKPKPRAKSPGASARALNHLEPLVASRPCIGPSLQQRFPRLRALVSENLRAPISEHAAASSTQPCPPAPLPSSDDDDLNHAPPKAESSNQHLAQEEGGMSKGIERRDVVDAESAVSPAVPAALAAPLLLAAPAGLSRAAAAAPAPRKQRSRPCNIPKS